MSPSVNHQNMHTAEVEMVDINRLWDTSGGNELLKGRKDFQNFVESLSGYEKVFQLKDRIVRCIDERTPGGKRLAGSGVLNKNIINDLLDKNLDGLTSHEFCGAGGIYVREQGIETDNSDQAVEDKIKEIGDRIELPFAGRITFDRMAELDGTGCHSHFARVFYYACIDFDPTQVEGMPVGFVLSRDLISDPQQAVREGKIGLSIAFGDHSLFKDKFSSKTPFYLIGVLDEDDREGLEKIQKELAEIKGRNQAVVIDYIFRRKNNAKH